MITLVAYETDGQVVNLSLEEIISALDNIGKVVYDYQDHYEMLDDIPNRVIESYAEDNLGMIYDNGLDDLEEIQRNVANMLQDVFIEMCCDRDPKEQLNILFREYLNREL